MTTALDTRVKNLAGNREAKQAAAKFGLDIMNISWEDNGRTKGSCWGPCISDMSLRCRGSLFPAVRFPNFSDLTCDIPFDKFVVMVGNETGSILRPVTLKDYLSDINQYLKPGSVHGDKRIPSLYVGGERDANVLVSAQSTFLPANKKDSPEFDVQLYNYQTRTGDPKVLTILVTSHGTSPQLLNQGTQQLYHNDNGTALHHRAVRLSTHRNDGKATNLQTVLTKEEKAQNVLMIIQVPITCTNPPKPKPVPRKTGGKTGGLNLNFPGAAFLKKKCYSAAPAPGSSMMDTGDVLEGCCDESFDIIKGEDCMYDEDGPLGSESEGEVDYCEEEADDCDEVLEQCSVSAPPAPPAPSAPPMPPMAQAACAAPAMASEESVPRRRVSASDSQKKKKKTSEEPEVGTGSEHAILKLGGRAGAFPTFGDTQFVRDERFPIRVTMQFYKVTDTDNLQEKDFASMLEQVQQAHTAATAVGSLVVDGRTGRTTEHSAQPPKPAVPTWWVSFKMMHQQKLSNCGLTEDEALLRLHRAGVALKTYSSMAECERDAVAALGLAVPNDQPTFVSGLF